MENELYRIFDTLDVTKLSLADKYELIHIFNVVDDTNLRNRIALLFSDLTFNDAIPHILKKINDPMLYNNNATLVYALYDLDVKPYFESIIEIICGQEYESRLNALQIVDKFINFISKETKERSLDMLRAKKEQIEKKYNFENYKNSTLNFIDETIDLLQVSD
ncbi:hypothetical protein ACJVDH_06020 [Pedobacter sp. AW1-32]|uniref:hypothetical protein n=1 Tax=Pedobacter sp. AW1-32 TaxID=3383026 RepID=UPI003FEEAD31